MKIIWAVFKKEGLDTLRDRRAIIAMIIIPMVIFPVIFGGIGFLMIKNVQKEQQRILKLGIVLPVPDSPLVESFEENDGFELSELSPEIIPKQEVENSELDAVLVFNADFTDKLAGTGAGELTLHYRSTGNGGITRNRIMNVIRSYQTTVRESRIQNLGYNLEFINPVKVNFEDTATQQEQIGEAVGGFIPYIFIILCFTGAMYPAIDLGAGEKERGTLETLLTSSAPLMHIILGKLALIVCSGLFAASLSLTSMGFAMLSMGPMVGEFASQIGPMLQPLNIVLFFSLLLPLTILFASFLMTMSLFAKSFKEAQSIISPMMALIILPLVFGMLPWVKLSYVTALVPILNVSLASKAIFSGNVDWGPVAVVYLSLIALAAIGFVACTKLVGKESILFRS